MPQDRARPGVAPPAGGTPSNPTTGGATSQVGTYFLGRYRVVDEIGIGGMASVHLARMDGPGGFQKWVAIKRIHPHLIEDDSFIQMFLDEARVAARISHPNVASVFELGKHEDTYWIAMEYLHGEPLREVMRRTEELGAPMPPEIACRVIADAAEGLNAAHELLGKNGEKLNLIHRDVTPHNLFVTYDGATKVVDFGIAKFSSRMASTRAGTLKGKLAYMSPEQVQGEAIDRRTDIFALGVVLWELTTGQRLFRMDSDLDTLAKVQECNIPRPSSIVKGYPIDLEKIVMKALAKNRGERFKTAREFSRALQSLLMRRGLFIASDEVATYVQSIFQERIQKRDAHLRWAGEVTQTINIDNLIAPAPATLGAPIVESSAHSDVQASPSTVRGAPRPAAGAPAASAAAGVNRLAETMQAPAARGVPTRREEPHPADDDGPTVQATAQQRGAAEYAGASGFEDEFDDNDATIVTTTNVGDRTSAPPVLPTVSPTGAPLIPAAGRPAGGGPAPGRPAAGNPAGAPGVQLPPRPPLGGNNRTLPIGTQAPSFPPNYPRAGGPGGSGPAPAPTYGYAASVPQNLNISDPSLPSTRIGSRDDFAFGQQDLASTEPAHGGGAPGAHGGGPPGAHGGGPPGAPGVGAPQGPGGMPMQEMGPSGMGSPMQAQPRLFAPPSRDQRTQTAQAFAVPPVPMWAIAAASGMAALFVAAIVLLIVSHSGSSSSAAPKVGLNTAPTMPVPPSQRVTPATPAPGAPGIFASARIQFLAAIVPPAPTTMVAPAPPPTSVAANDDAPARQPPPPSPPPAVAAVDPTPAPRPAPPSTPGPAAAASPVPQSGPTPLGGSAPGPRRVSAGDSAGGGQGMISVICIPACDQVVDNGKPLGASPIFKRSVPVGAHRLRLLSSGYGKTVSVSVVADQLSVVRESMQP